VSFAAIPIDTPRRLWVEWHAGLLRLLHIPAVSVPVIAFPLIAYLLLVVVLGPPEATGGVARHVVATCTLLGVIAPGVIGLAVGLAIGRRRGLLDVKRPLSILPGVLVAALTSLILMVLAATVGEILLELLQLLSPVLHRVGLSQLS
jgi:hypothetical protein